MRATIGRVAAVSLSVLAFGTLAFAAGDEPAETNGSRIVIADLASSKLVGEKTSSEAATVIKPAEQAPERKVRMVGPSLIPDE